MNTESRSSNGDYCPLPITEAGGFVKLALWQCFTRIVNLPTIPFRNPNRVNFNAEMSSLVD